MSETWLSMATRWTGPGEKQGYSNLVKRDLALIKGEIKHSMVGSFTAAMARLSSTDLASWTFSVTKVGEIYQHYPLESVTWHAGSPGANFDYIGIEHEGGPPGNEHEPFTDAQYQATLALSREIRRLLPQLGPPSRDTNLKEHNEMHALYGSPSTACPSGRIPWGRLIAGLTAEATVPPPNTEGQQIYAWLKAAGIEPDSDGVSLLVKTIKALLAGRSDLPPGITGRW